MTTQVLCSLLTGWANSHLATVTDSIVGQGTAQLFVDRVLRQHGLSVAIFFERDPPFTSKFWKSIFQVVGTRLNMFAVDHLQTDG